MRYFITQFAATSNYNCEGAADASYGAGSYGTCVGVDTNPTEGTTTETTQPGAPNTGGFFGYLTSGSFSIILPLLIAIVVVAAASITVLRARRRSAAQPAAPDTPDEQM